MLIVLLSFEHGLYYAAKQLYYNDSLIAILYSGSMVDIHQSLKLN